MEPVEYHTVFDVTTAGFRSWSFSAFGLIFVAAGLLLPLLIRAGVVRKTSPTVDRWFPRFVLGFAILWTSGSFLSTYGDYRSAVDAMQGRHVQVVEGVVTAFHPMPASGHAMESFAVAGVKFAYSDYVITAGFNQTASHGGPIRQGLPVRIWHSNGEILRLDIGRALKK